MKKVKRKEKFKKENVSLCWLRKIDLVINLA
jgi:hypothetical protein